MKGDVVGTKTVSERTYYLRPFHSDLSVSSMVLFSTFLFYQVYINCMTIRLDPFRNMFRNEHSWTRETGERVKDGALKLNLYRIGVFCSNRTR